MEISLKRVVVGFFFFFFFFDVLVAVAVAFLKLSIDGPYRLYETYGPSPVRISTTVLGDMGEVLL